MSMVTWIEEESGMLGAPVLWLGQDATTVNHLNHQQNGKLTTIELISLAGVIISGVSLGLSLWSLATKGRLS
jgi:hypothetical protein